jgi:cell division protein FtsA
MVERTTIHAGLDLGTTKVCCVIAEADIDGERRIIGVGTAPSEGLRRGVVIDVGKTVQSIQRAVDEAQTAAGVELRAVTAGIAGEHIGSLDSSGAVAVEGRDHEVGPGDRERAVEAARTVAIPFDREVLHVLPQEFAVDDQRGVRDPVGMTGVRLHADVHIVTGAVTSVQNVCKSVQRAGLEVEDIVLEPLASSRCLIGEEERDVGVALIDVGGGTTDLALFHGGSVRRTAVIGVGGQSVTSDIAICLRTSWGQADRLKLEHGTARVPDEEDDQYLLVSTGPGRPRDPVSRGQLAAIVEARMEEIFRLVGEQIDGCPGGDRLGAGIVLTGGGALVEGAVELAERVLQRPVRLAAPAGTEGIGERVASPIYATAVGLAWMAADGTGDTRPRRGLSEGRVDSVAGRMREWFEALL